MMFKQFFLDPTSSTFWNVRGSAIRAGFSTEYANNITVQEPKWWLELKESAEFDRAEFPLQQQARGVGRRPRITVAPPSITTMDIYRGIIPFVVIQLVGLALIATFPALATWLPSVLF